MLVTHQKAPGTSDVQGADMLKLDDFDFISTALLCAGQYRSSA
jgi:hypothetical protein